MKTPRGLPYVLAGSALILWAGHLTAQVPIGVRAPADPVVIPGLLRHVLQTLDLPATEQEPFTAEVQLGDQMRTLVLDPYTMRADDFRVLVQGEDGQLREVEAPPPRSFRGTVQREPLSRVSGTLADLGDQLFKLLANDGAADDEFGHTVAVSGVTAIVGAYLNDDNGSQSGSAYLFDTTTGFQIFKFLPNDGAAVDQFGFSVAISGAIAIVGAYRDDDNGTNSGSAYLFDSDITAGGGQIAKLLPNDGAAFDWFGLDVAISGSTVIVGAERGNDNGTTSGSAYLFDITDPANPTQLFKLLPDDGAQGDEFGHSVAISGAIAIVGAHRDEDNGSNSGSAYLFDATTGRQIAKLLPKDGAAGDFFGSSVAISGAPGEGIAIVGAWQNVGNGTDSGSAYLFDATTGRQIAKLLPDDGAFFDWFGWSVAISGATAIVAAPLHDDNGTWSGSAYLFDISEPANPVQIAKLLPDDGAACNQFGWSVAVSGATAIIGARFDDDHGIDSGSAYLFDAAAPGICPWDLDGNGTVGVGDLLILVANFGPCDDQCPADFDEDGFVGVLDLLVLIANFGACPGTGCPWDVNGDGVVNHLDVIAVNDNMGPCKDPDNCPWDVNGDGVVNGADVSEVASHFGPCPKE